MANRNTETLGICLGGWYNYDHVKCRDGDPPQIQLQAAGWLIRKLMKDLNIAADHVLTHNKAQTGGKLSCPGNSGTKLVETIHLAKQELNT